MVGQSILDFSANYIIGPLGIFAVVVALAGSIFRPDMVPLVCGELDRLFPVAYKPHRRGGRRPVRLRADDVSKVAPSQRDVASSA
jgi:hypothetical protein